MQPKLYVTNYPAGDFRAMPALGGGHALLKWVTSFPGNPGARAADRDRARDPLGRGDGCVEAVLDAGSVTALRTGAAAALAAETLGRPAASAAVVGAGVNGRAAARSLQALGRDVVALGRRRRAGALVAARARRRRRREPDEALGADVVVTVTPGKRDPAARGLAAAGPAREPDGRRRPGQGGDRGRGDPARARSSATSGSRRATAASSPRRSRPGAITRGDVTELGAVSTGEADGRRSRGRDHALRLDRPRDPGSRDRDRRATSGRRARPTSSTSTL